MGSGGPGNITHIDNLYVKQQKVEVNTKILLGDYLIFDTTGVRPLVAGDFTADDRFINTNEKGIVQAAETADNLNSTPINDRKTLVTVITKGSDWINKMDANIAPGIIVGIKRLDSHTPVFIAAALANGAPPTFGQVLGVYKHKEFATIADITVDNDDGTVSTGVA